MIVVRHYVNLIGWRDILDVMNESNKIKDKQNHIYYCDSLTLMLAAKLFGCSVKLRPGPTAMAEVNLFPENEVQYLTARKISKSSIVLPMFYSTLEMMRYSDDYSPSKHNIVIGISTPKQNQLALYIAQSLNDLEDYNIWCLGAAVYDEYKIKYTANIYWISFLIKQPKRTIVKILSTVAGFFGAFHPRNRNDFKKFIAFLECV